MGGDARYYYALTDEEKLRLEAILQLPDEELEINSAFTNLSTTQTQGKEGEGEGGGGEGQGNRKEEDNGKSNEKSDSAPKEILVNPDDYIKYDSKKTLKNGYLPTVEEFDKMKEIDE